MAALPVIVGIMPLMAAELAEVIMLWSMMTAGAIWSDLDPWGGTIEVEADCTGLASSDAPEVSLALVVWPK